MVANVQAWGLSSFNCPGAKHTQKHAKLSLWRYSAARTGTVSPQCPPHPPQLACAGSSSALVREQAARAISGLVQGQALLAVQGSQRKLHILLSACREAEACRSGDDRPSPWDLDVGQKPLGSLPSPQMSGLELLPNLTGLEALAEQLIFQANGHQEHAEVCISPPTCSVHTVPL